MGAAITYIPVHICDVITKQLTDHLCTDQWLFTKEVCYLVGYDVTELNITVSNGCAHRSLQFGLATESGERWQA